MLRASAQHVLHLAYQCLMKPRLRSAGNAATLAGDGIGLANASQMRHARESILINSILTDITFGSHELGGCIRQGNRI